MDSPSPENGCDLDDRLRHAHPRIVEEVDGLHLAEGRHATSSAFAVFYEAGPTGGAAETAAVAQDLGVLVPLVRTSNEGSSDEAARTPTSPGDDGGAGEIFRQGITSMAIDPSAAADRFALASNRFGDDLPSSAYAILLAAALKEEAGEPETARRILSSWRRVTGAHCPSLELHLARLGSDVPTRTYRALLGDPLLDADVAALELVGSDEAIARRRGLSEHELELLTGAAERLASFAPPDQRVHAAPIGRSHSSPLVLTELESAVSQAIWRCDAEIARGNNAIGDWEVAQRERETELERATNAQESCFRFFMIALALAIALALTIIVDGVLTAIAPGLAAPLGTVIWQVQIALPIAGAIEFRRAWLVYQRYARVRTQRLSLVELRYVLDESRRDFMVSSHDYHRARRHAELCISRISARRRGVIPSRPVPVHRADETGKSVPRDDQSLYSPT